MTNQRIKGIIEVSHKSDTTRMEHKMATSAVKAGSLYTTSLSGINGIVEEVTKHNGRNVVRLLTLDGEIFSTVPRGVRVVQG